MAWRGKRLDNRIRNRLRGNETAAILASLHGAERRA